MWDWQSMNGDASRPPAADTEGAAADARETRQFGIRGFLWFILLCALWLPQPPIFKGAWEAPRGVDFTQNGIALTNIFLAWGVLSLFCLRQRFYGIFFCHLLLPLVGTGILLVRDGVQNLWHGFVLIVLVMNLVCFPGAVLAMVSRWLHRPARGTKPGNDSAFD
jgi:hypothetical protein